MLVVVAPSGHDASVTTLLDQEVYADTDAARLLRVKLSTLRWWLEGRQTPERTYAPVLRPEPTGSRSLTWGEFVEAAYLRAYRREHGVRLGELRVFISYLRDAEGLLYPLAHHRPWVGPGRALLIAAQDAAGMPEEMWAAVAVPSGQMLLLEPGSQFVERVDFNDADLASRFYPAGREVPVVIDPTMRFGSPNVRGVSTQAIVDAVHAGEVVETVADDFGLTLEDAAAALTYERLLLAA